MSIQIGDGTTNVVVDTVSKGVLVQNPKVASQAGFAALAATVDAGAITLTPLVRPISATPQNRAEVSQVSPLFTDTFNYTAQDTSRWANTLTTFTQSWGGYTTFNSGLSIAANATSLLKTYGSWPLPTEGTLVFRMFGYQTQIAQVHCVTEFGFLQATGVAAPTDGAFFRFDATGALSGVANYNGVEQLIAITSPTPSVNTLWKIVLDETHVEFWINNVLQGQLQSAAGNGQPIMSSYVQLAIRMYHTTTGPSIANQLRISDIDLWHTDGAINRSSVYERTQAGLNASQGAAGMTMGSTALYTNSTNPTAAVPTNTTAALGVGLGGLFLETATIAVGTDGIICSYLNPVGTVNTPGRKLVITGYSWTSIPTVTLVGGAFVYCCGLAYGHTALSLATAESAVSKAPRRVTVGLYSLAANAAVGTLGAKFDHQFITPIVVNPGEYIAMFTKNMGTVGTGGTIAHTISFDSHWE